MLEQGHLGKQIAERLIDVTLDRIGAICWENTLINKPLVNKTVSDLRDRIKSTSNAAIVVAAGPSVKRQNLLEKLRVSDFQGLIIVADSALAPCLRLDIVPDIVVSVDPHDRILRWFGDPDLTPEKQGEDDYFRRQDMSDWVAQNELRANQETLALLNRYGDQVVAALATCAAKGVPQRCLESGMEMYWWNPMYDDYDLPDSLTRKVYSETKAPCINAGGNVGTSAWVLAHSILGIEHVALLGMDFAYYSDTPYARTQYYDRLLELFPEEKLEEIFIHLHNPYLGADFYTDPAYFWYRDVFLEMSVDAPCQTYNCTEGGILFGDNIEFIPLEEFAKRVYS